MGRLSNQDWETQSRTDHLLRATRAALVLPWFVNRDGQTIAASVAPCFFFLSHRALERIWRATTA
jgi:hypothetical protein